MDTRIVLARGMEMSFKSHGYATGSNAQIKEAANAVLKRREDAILSETFRVMQLLLRAAEHLLLAATGPEDAPEPWSKVRERWLEQAKAFK